MNEKEIYRKRLVNTYKSLIAIHQELFNGITNVAMAGELKEIDSAFDVGDVFEFDIEYFKNSKDINLRKLVEFYEQLNDLMNSLANINAIKENELE